MFWVRCSVPDQANHFCSVCLCMAVRAAATNELVGLGQLDSSFSSGVTAQIVNNPCLLIAYLVGLQEVLFAACIAI